MAKIRGAGVARWMAQDGKPGDNAYLHIRYSPYADGQNMTVFPVHVTTPEAERSRYRGLMSNNSIHGSSDYRDYEWEKMSEDGKMGLTVILTKDSHVFPATTGGVVQGGYTSGYTGVRVTSGSEQFTCKTSAETLPTVNGTYTILQRTHSAGISSNLAIVGGNIELRPTSFTADLTATITLTIAIMHDDELIYSTKTVSYSKAKQPGAPWLIKITKDSHVFKGTDYSNTGFKIGVDRGEGYLLFNAHEPIGNVSNGFFNVSIINSSGIVTPNWYGTISDSYRTVTFGTVSNVIGDTGEMTLRIFGCANGVQFQEDKKILYIRVPKAAGGVSVNFSKETVPIVDSTSDATIYVTVNEGGRQLLFNNHGTEGNYSAQFWGIGIESRSNVSQPTFIFQENDCIIGNVTLNAGKDSGQITYRIFGASTTWAQFTIYKTVRYQKSSSETEVIPGPPGKDGQDGRYTVWQFAKNKSATTAPTSGWQNTQPTLATGDYLWARSGTVIPPATQPTSWSATRLSGEQGARGLDGRTQVQVEWQQGAMHYNDDEVVYYIYMRQHPTDNDLNGTWWKLRDGVASYTAPAAPELYPQIYERVQDFKRLAVNFLIAEEANLANFIFKKGMLMSLFGRTHAGLEILYGDFTEFQFTTTTTTAAPTQSATWHPLPITGTYLWFRKRQVSQGLTDAWTTPVRTTTTTVEYSNMAEDGTWYTTYTAGRVWMRVRASASAAWGLAELISIADGYDFFPNIILDGLTGQLIMSGGKNRFEPDGSGILAGGNIKWTKEGHTEFLGGLKSPFVGAYDQPISGFWDKDVTSWANNFYHYSPFSSLPTDIIPCSTIVNGQVFRYHVIRGAVILRGEVYNAFQENGSLIDQIQLSPGDALEMICVCIDNAFHSWDIIRRYKCRRWNQ